MKRWLGLLFRFFREPDDGSDFFCLFKLGVPGDDSTSALEGQGEGETVGVRNGVFCFNPCRQQGEGGRHLLL